MVEQPTSAKKQIRPDLSTRVGPLGNPGWLEFNRQKWGLDPRSFRRGNDSSEGPTLAATYYVDAKRRIYHPSRNPYMAIGFQPSPSNSAGRSTRQWLELADFLVAEMRQRGVYNTLNLSPNVSDIRPWLWAGFQASIRYTYVVDFPYNESLVSKELRRKLRASAKENYRIDRTYDMEEVAYCLAGSEERQGFDLGLSAADYELCRQLMGDDAFRAYVAYTPSGEPMSSTILFHQPGAMALGWVGGTRTEHLNSGVVHLVDVFTFKDLQENGAIGLDLCGANIRGVANAKSNWGARLVPYYSIEAYSVRRLAKWSMNWYRFMRARRQKQ